MAEERDPLVSRRYRELGSEEPPPALDEAILAAARRAAAPRRRWYLPLAAAAVAVLGVGVALHVQREQPDPAIMTAPSEAKDAPSEVQRKSPPAVRPEATQQSRKREAAPDPGARESRSEERAPAPAQPASPSRPAAVPQTAPAPPAAGDVLGARVLETPERWLDRIADLRRQGRHEEADKALADFRRRYPDYRIAEQMLEKIEMK
jgi:hypothetical protein